MMTEVSNQTSLNLFFPVLLLILLTIVSVCELSLGGVGGGVGGGS